jgi:hypothetical protein
VDKNEAIKQARNAYMKAWRKKNKDKTKKYNENYWAKVSKK